MSALDHPAACFPAGFCAFGLRFFLALLDVRLIAPRLDGVERCLALVSGVGAEMLRAFGSWFRPRRHYSVQRRLQQFHVMYIGPAGGER
jgi:hypothetical protein